MKEKIIQAFANLGFTLEHIPGFGQAFQHEQYSYFWLDNDDDDEHFLNISLPWVVECNGVDELRIYKFVENVNATLKYVKAFISEDHVCLFYERKLYEGDNLEQIITHMIHALALAHDEIRRDLIKRLDADDESDDLDDDDDSELFSFDDDLDLDFDLDC